MGSTGTKTAVNATELRSNLFQHLETAAKGTPVEIKYKGKEYQLMVVAPKSKLERFYAAGEPETIISDANDPLFSDKVKLKQQRDEEWIAKWDKRLGRK
jgi:antitoxin (DNA-binding transcriptional repressor) of toxin-antitoxin stability system